MPDPPTIPLSPSSSYLKRSLTPAPYTYTYNHPAPAFNSNDVFQDADCSCNSLPAVVHSDRICHEGSLDTAHVTHPNPHPLGRCSSKMHHIKNPLLGPFGHQSRDDLLHEERSRRKTFKPILPAAHLVTGLKRAWPTSNAQNTARERLRRAHFAGAGGRIKEEDISSTEEIPIHPRTSFDLSDSDSLRDKENRLKFDSHCFYNTESSSSEESMHSVHVPSFNGSKYGATNGWGMSDTDIIRACGLNLDISARSSIGSAEDAMALGQMNQNKEGNNMNTFAPSAIPDIHHVEGCKVAAREADSAVDELPCWPKNSGGKSECSKQKFDPAPVVGNKILPLSAMNEISNGTYQQPRGLSGDLINGDPDHEPSVEAREKIGYDTQESTPSEKSKNFQKGPAVLAATGHTATSGGIRVEEDDVKRAEILPWESVEAQRAQVVPWEFEPRIPLHLKPEKHHREPVRRKPSRRYSDDDQMYHDTTGLMPPLDSYSEGETEEVHHFNANISPTQAGAPRYYESSVESDSDSEGDDETETETESSSSGDVTAGEDFMPMGLSPRPDHDVRTVVSSDREEILDSDLGFSRRCYPELMDLQLTIFSRSQRLEITSTGL